MEIIIDKTGIMLQTNWKGFRNIYFIFRTKRFSFGAKNK